MADFINYFPLASAIFILCLAFLILFQGDRKDKKNITFVLFVLAISIWMVGTFMMLMSKHDISRILFWDKIVYTGVVFIPAIMYHFGLALINRFSRNTKIFLYAGYLVSLFFLLIIPTDYLIHDAFVYKWGAHSKAGPLHNLFLVYFVAYLSGWFVLVSKHWRRLKNKKEKRQVEYSLLAFLILAVVGSTGFLPAYGVSVYPFSYISGLIFAFIIFLSIARYNLFNIKVILTEILVFILWALIAIEFFLAETFHEILVESIVLTAVVIFGIFLIKSVSGEVSRREETEKLVSELREVNEKLRELDQIKSDFISIASHQLRTPLTAIKGYTSMLLEGVYGDVPIKARGVIDKIFQSSQRLVYIVNDMLDVTRIEGGRLKYDFEDVRLMNVVNDVVEELKPNALRKKLKFNFHIDVDDADIMVYADSNKIRQAITNLIDNSIKYTNAGFVLVFVSRSGDGKGALITIKDSGLGMTKDTLSIIFNKFFRAKGALKSHTEGSGLGLYVAREIIRAHSGDVWADSEGPGRGSQFYIQLPIKKG